MLKSAASIIAHESPSMKTDLLSTFDISDSRVQSLVEATLKGADDGELYVE